MFEKIAQHAFNDELEKIAKKLNPEHVINPYRTGKLNARPINPKFKGQSANKLVKGLKMISKAGIGALALSGLAFGAGSMMASNSGAEVSENGY